MGEHESLRDRDDADRSCGSQRQQQKWARLLALRELVADEMRSYMHSMAFFGGNRVDLIDGIEGSENPLDTNRAMLTDDAEEARARGLSAKVTLCKEQLKAISGLQMSMLMARKENGGDVGEDRE